MKLLCLSNGHGEDAIAVRILEELQQSEQPLELGVLPIVGEGHAYRKLEVDLAGPVQTMPSGGFVYMDSRQLLRDLKGGLLQLTLAQFRAVRQWAKQGGVILAVGDIVPLLFAWLSGAPYAFVGTAKSEYYLQDEAGLLPRKSLAEKLENWSGSVYLPWERWLMSHSRCKAVFPRDQLTTQILQRWEIPAYDLGNPMMDGLAPSHARSPLFYDPEQETREMQRSLTVLLLPGSRPPEAYRNWQTLLQAVVAVIQFFPRKPLVFLAAITPSLDRAPFQEALLAEGWQVQKEASNPLPDPATTVFQRQGATLVISQQAYNDCLDQADFAIAMAGTATEQFVGLGKPAVTLAGQGPQFTPAFAEAQTRLLGPSVTLVRSPEQVPQVFQSLLRDPDRLQLIAENGQRRMGTAGAAQRIAQKLWECLS